MTTCEICTRLTAVYERLERSHASAKADVLTYWGGSHENGRRRIAVNDAWLDFEMARLELEEHRRVHGTVT